MEKTARHIRVIPRLDIKGPNLVKGVHLEGLRVLGRPEQFSSKYYLDGADELIYIDSVASLYRRNNLTEIVTRAARNIFVPLTVGGGIRSVDDIRTILRCGADKVAINTAAFQTPELITEGARAFGSQCMVVSIQARRLGNSYECLSDNAREKTGVDVFSWAQRAETLGAGELLVTSVDNDGTGVGYDLELMGRVADLVKIPVIAFGGAGKIEHILDLIQQTKVSGVCAASIFHYGILDQLHTSGLYGSEGEGNVEFLKGSLPLPGRARRTIVPVSICDLKKVLSESAIPCRYKHTERKHDRTCSHN